MPVRRDPSWYPGKYAGARVRYIQRINEINPNLEFVQQHPCPVCDTGFLALQPDTNGYGDMWVCTEGCSQRFFEEMD